MKDTTPVHGDSDSEHDSKIQESCQAIDNLFYEFHNKLLASLTLRTNDPPLQQTIQKLEAIFDSIQNAMLHTKEEIPNYTQDKTVQQFLESLYELVPHYDCEINAYIDYRIAIMKTNNYLTPLRLHAENLESSKTR